MSRTLTLDALVKTRLRTWPQRPPGLGGRSGGRDSWFRGRPGPKREASQPFLKLPGCGQLRTIPDGLWLNFGGTPAEPYVDILAVEACGTLPNMYDKRSRFAPSTQSLMAVCPMPWLLGPSDDGAGKARWRTIRQIRCEPYAPFIVPVRDRRVMYALKRDQYAIVTHGLIPHPHEYFVPMEALTAEGGADAPAMRALMARASASANFLEPSDVGIEDAGMEDDEQMSEVWVERAMPPGHGQSQPLVGPWSPRTTW